MKGNQGVCVWQLFFLIAWQRRGGMLENGAREFAPQLVCPDQTYSSAGRVSMSTRRDARGGAASARCFLGELVAVGASIAHKWSLTTVSSPLHPLFQIQLWKSWRPNRTLPAAEMFLWWLHRV